MSRGKPDLSIRWSRREKALLYDGPSPTGGMLSTAFELRSLECIYGGPGSAGRDDDWLRRSLAGELEARGYDLTTLRFSIRKKATP